MLAFSLKCQKLATVILLLTCAEYAIAANIVCENKQQKVRFSTEKYDPENHAGLTRIQISWPNVIDKTIVLDNAASIQTDFSGDVGVTRYSDIEKDHPGFPTYTLVTLNRSDALFANKKVSVVNYDALLLRHEVDLDERGNPKGSSSHLTQSPLLLTCVKIRTPFDD